MASVPHPQQHDVQELSAAAFWDKVYAARKATPESKFIDGARLFEWACQITTAGIRNLHPTFTDEQVRQEMRRRLVIGKRLENR